MALFNIDSDSFQKAVRSIQRRAERQEEISLVKSFVPNKVLEELDTPQNQLLFGRRGVGKTHTLKAFLGKKVQEGDLCHYIDCTAFGSGLALDGSYKNIGIRFFSKFLSVLCDELLEDATRAEMPSKTLHNDLESILFQLSHLASPSSNGETFNYLDITRFTTRFLDKLNANNLTILIDEWAQIPENAQPYFAEFIKRAFFSNKRISFKIGVVDFAYKLCMRCDDHTIGLEKSADIFADIKMDRFFVWDEHSDFVEMFFAEVLYNHLAIELKYNLDAKRDDKVNCISEDLFTQRRALSELCRSSEGNARDFLAIFGRAFNNFNQHNLHKKISVEDVLHASQSWYKSDKAMNISTEKYLEDFLDNLVHSVIRDKKSRTFMVPSRSWNHPLLRRLFSARILHPLNIEWSHPDRPGERYSLITMDYGLYVSFKGTRNEPDQKLFWEINDVENANREDLVPFDDRRSIRRIVLGEDVLEQYWGKIQKELSDSLKTT